ncbi:MAG: hypothetical protein Q7U28_08115 [Aquabacterium sp.]|nr:hypothetical protein [Aquabacterium sp.]
MSIAIAQFEKLALSHVIGWMQTISETRVARLAMLVKKYGNSLAQLNEALGLDRTDSTLSQIRTSAPHSKTGKTRGMGDNLARKIEDRLKLEKGWMDTPPTYAELHGEEDPRTKVMQLMESMPPDQWATVVRLVDAVAQPTKKVSNGE